MMARVSEPLIAKIEEQEKEILRLESKINKDSGNSLKPPTVKFSEIDSENENMKKEVSTKVCHL